mmetsp:Transcript_20722/g.70503  ORF Transcript_20722/g.70503 Transcript_20722/m.70503 type:complete len:188 (-) Transcript_20722:1643-2206(-)
MALCTRQAQGRAAGRLRGPARAGSGAGLCLRRPCARAPAAGPEREWEAAAEAAAPPADKSVAGITEGGRRVVIEEGEAPGTLASLNFFEPMPKHYYPTTTVDVVFYSLRTGDAQGVLFAASPTLVRVGAPVCGASLLWLLATGSALPGGPAVEAVQLAGLAGLLLGGAAEWAKFMEAVLGVETRRKM